MNSFYRDRNINSSLDYLARCYLVIYSTLISSNNTENIWYNTFDRVIARIRFGICFELQICKYTYVPTYIYTYNVERWFVER